MAGVPEGRITEDQGGGEIAIEKQLLRAVEVGQDGVEQTSALDQAGFQVAPFGGRDQEWDSVQTPGAIGAQRIAVDVVGNAVFTDSLAGDLPAVG